MDNKDCLTADLWLLSFGGTAEKEDRVATGLLYIILYI